MRYFDKPSAPLGASRRPKPALSANKTVVDPGRMRANLDALVTPAGPPWCARGAEPEGGKGKKVVDREKVKEQRRRRKMKKWRLIVRNLPFNIEEAALRKHFEEYGEVVECSISNAKKRKQTASDAKEPMDTAQGSGFAFIQFKQFPNAHKALKAVNMQQIQGRTVALDWAVPKDTYLTATLEGKDKCRNEALMNTEMQSCTTSGAVQDDSVPVALQSPVKREAPSDSSGDESEGENEADDGSGDESTSHSDSASDSDDESAIKKGKKKKNRSGPDNVTPASDRAVEEGRTLFVRNLSFDTTDVEFRNYFSKFGRIHYALICKYPDTEHSKGNRPAKCYFPGSGFVQFEKKEDADSCIAKASLGDASGGLTLGGRRLSVCVALQRAKVVEMEKLNKQKTPNDQRNLHLMRIGVIRPGSKEANSMSAADVAKREKIIAANREKVKNLHVFVSPVRLVVHNMPKTIDDAALRRLCVQAAVDTSARVMECRIWRDRSKAVDDSDTNAITGVKAKPKKGKALGQSLGFGFVQFSEHRHALSCLETLNNNPSTFSDVKRPIVEFSLENKVALNKKQRRVDKCRQIVTERKGNPLQTVKGQHGAPFKAAQVAKSHKQTFPKKKRRRMDATKYLAMT